VNEHLLTFAATGLFLASAVVGPKGKMGPFLRVDIFHYLLAASICCFWMALNQQMF
jgi:hypothetical protein